MEQALFNYLWWSCWIKEDKLVVEKGHLLSQFPPEASSSTGAGREAPDIEKWVQAAAWWDEPIGQKQSVKVGVDRNNKLHSGREARKKRKEKETSNQKNVNGWVLIRTTCWGGENKYWRWDGGDLTFWRGLANSTCRHKGSMLICIKTLLNRPLM